MALEPPISNIPIFRPDGYLPEGVHVCSEAEVIFRFGSSGRRRRRLVRRLRRWIELGRQVGLGGMGGLLSPAGVRKMIARLHEELALYEGSLEARQAH